MNSRVSVPTSWVVTKLGDFVENEKGKKPKSESKLRTDSHTLPYVDIKAFEEGVINSWTNGDGCRLCNESDFLMVWDGARAGLVGRGVTGALGSTLVRINFPSMVNDYAYYFLLSKYQQINTRAKGSGTPHVDPDLLWNYEFPIAPLNEQHRIVAKIEELFSELDKGIENLKTAREQLKVYRQALLKHAFEGKLTAQWRAARAVTPAKAGVHTGEKLDSRFRGNDERGGGNDALVGGNDEPLEPAAALLARIQTEREQRYRQQLQQWQANGGSKPKAPKPLPPFSAEELAELPDGWISLCVESLFEIEDGDRGEHYPTKGDFADSGYCLFLNAKNVTKRGFAFQEMSFISEQKHLALRKGTLKRGDIVFTSRGTLGNIAHYDDSIKYEHVRINSGMFIIRDYDIALTPDFLYYHLNSPIITRQIERLQSGTAQPQLPIREFKSFRFVIPSKEEQYKIVQELESKLSEVDQLDQTLAASLQQSEALRQSILKKAFAGTLVAQDANDEPATALLARIRAEKQIGNQGAKKSLSRSKRNE